MRFRQTYLDFHTSPLNPGIGSRFDARAFAQVFKDAYADSVTIFSKCPPRRLLPTDLRRQDEPLTASISSKPAQSKGADVFKIHLLRHLRSSSVRI